MKSITRLFFLLFALISFEIPISFAGIVQQLTNAGDDTPLPRENFALVENPLNPKSFFLSFGNFYNNATNNITFYNDLWSFEQDAVGVANYTWRQIPTFPLDGTPSARSLHCFNILQNGNQPPFLSVVGGSSSSLDTGLHVLSPDFFYLLDTTTFTWQNKTDQAIGDGFAPRTGATCASKRSVLWVSLGVVSGGTLTTELWQYDLNNPMWLEKSPFPGTARWLATATMLVTYRFIYMYLHGGCDTYPIVTSGGISINETNILNDSWYFNTFNETWIQITTLSDIVPKRLAPAGAFSRGGKRLQVYGGNILNATHLNDSFPIFNPSQFNFENQTCSAGEIGFTVGQLWEFDTTYSTWVNVTLEPISPIFNTSFVPPVANARVIQMGQFLYLVGGTIIQCPFTGLTWNLDVTRITPYLSVLTN